MNASIPDKSRAADTPAEPKRSVDRKVGRLKACINDLTSLLSLPAIWTGREPREIIAALLDVLMSILRLDAVYGEVQDPIDATLISMLHPVRIESPTEEQMDIQQALVSKRSVGDVSIVPLQLRFPDQIGWVVAASRRADFPTDTERLILNVATNRTVPAYT